MTENSPKLDRVPVDSLRPMSELLAREDVVYHGIGADIMALSGIAEHGLVPARKQVELSGTINSNTTRELAFNGDNLVSVVLPPKPGMPNDAFFCYIDSSPVAFAISATAGVSQPAKRGFLDEAFIEGAQTDAIAGIVVNGYVLDEPLANMPIVSETVMSDVVAEKARNYFDFIVSKLDASLADDKPKLEVLLDDITHLTPEYARSVMGMVGQADQTKIRAIDNWLRGELAVAMEHAFGRSLTVLEAVRLVFGDKPIFVNRHDQLHQNPENVYLSKLDPAQKIGYEKFDGKPGLPSVYQLRSFRRPD